ncbi:MAG: hypothetical protein ACHQX1_02425 [Candidatus Micrarchaeales archaeon]
MAVKTIDTHTNKENGNTYYTDRLATAIQRNAAIEACSYKMITGDYVGILKIIVLNGLGSEEILLAEKGAIATLSRIDYRSRLIETVRDRSRKIQQSMSEKAVLTLARR